MVLTEEQALEIAYRCLPRHKLQNCRHFFRDERDMPYTSYSYELFFIIGRSFDGHRTTDDYLIFCFGDEHSQVANDAGFSNWDITEIVNKYLEEHKATAGV